MLLQAPPESGDTVVRQTKQVRCTAVAPQANIRTRPITGITDPQRCGVGADRQQDRSALRHRQRETLALTRTVMTGLRTL